MLNRHLLCMSPVYLPLSPDDDYVVRRPELIYKSYESFIIIQVCLVGKEYPIVLEQWDSFGHKFLVIINERGDEHCFPVESNLVLADTGDGSYREFFTLVE